MPDLMNRANNRIRNTRFALANMPQPDRVMDLQHRQEYSLTGDRRYQTVACISGSVWITQEGDMQDYLLQEGEVFIITHRGLVIVRALEDSTIGLSPKMDKGLFSGRTRQTVFQ